jgi:hypothetical protein
MDCCYIICDILNRPSQENGIRFAYRKEKNY